MVKWLRETSFSSCPNSTMPFSSNSSAIRWGAPSLFFFFFSSRRRHTRCSRDWSSDVCSSDLNVGRDYLVRLGLPSEMVVPLAGEDTYASLSEVQRWFDGRTSRRVLLVSDGFHMLRLQIIASRLGLMPFTSPAPGSPIHANARRNTGRSEEHTSELQSRLHLVCRL